MGVSRKSRKRAIQIALSKDAFQDVKDAFQDAKGIFQDVKDAFQDVKYVFRDVTGMFRDVKDAFQDVTGMFREMKGVFHNIKRTFRARIRLLTLKFNHFTVLPKEPEETERIGKSGILPYILCV
jgi:phage-related minor tail protein